MEPRGQRQQSSTEYLIMYGVTFIIILGVIVILYSLFNSPGAKIPNTCTFTAAANCEDMIIGVNSVTSNTAMILLLDNAGDTPIVNPFARVSIGTLNSSWARCLPDYVKAGGSIICLVNSTVVSLSPGQTTSGKIYLQVGSCAFSSPGSCANTVNQVYVGTFEGTAERYNTGLNFGITLSTLNSPSSNGGTELVATLTLSGYPIKGATINFSNTANSIRISPRYSSTNSSGEAAAFANSTGGIFYANFTNTIYALSMNVIAQVPITLTNSQSSATPSGFSQMVYFNPSQAAYSANEVAGLGNLRFFIGNKELSSWCESGCNSSSSNAVFWVNLGSTTIAAYGGTATVNMIFLANTVRYDGAYAGEAPQLSTSYAKYDNGGRVFTYYQNAASIPNSDASLYGDSWGNGNIDIASSSLSMAAVGGSDALQITNPSFSVQDDYYFIPASNLQNAFVATIWAYTGSSGGSDTIIGEGSSANPNGGYADLFGACGSGDVGAMWSDTNTGSQNFFTSGCGPDSYPFNQWVTVGLESDGAGDFVAFEYPGQGAEANLAHQVQSGSDTTYTSFNNYVIFGAWIQNSGSNSKYFGDIIVRAYPPSGVMPGFSFGSLVP